MFIKAQIIKSYVKSKTRFFLSKLFFRQNINLIQYHSGGDDYNPMEGTEGICSSISNNPTNSFIFAWKDSSERKSLPGEKRIYSLKKDNSSDEVIIAAEIHLKNDGSININANQDLEINTNNCVKLNAKKILSNGTWQHNGNFIASHIEVLDGASGTYSNSVISSAGIVTGGN